MSTNSSSQKTKSETTLRILQVHNTYQQQGGEDAVVEEEAKMLRAKGHEVRAYVRSNHEIGSISSVALARDTIWSRKTQAEIEQLLDEFRPDIIHAHNTFPLISPSLYWVAAKRGTPLVQTLHNYRLLCAQGSLSRRNMPCTHCVGTLPWRGVLHGCYRGSRAQSAALVSMLGIHRALGTYRQKVTRYIALDDFCRDQLVQGGIPSEKISIKGNFVDIPEMPNRPRQGYVCVGRLSKEKGIDTLARAWRLMENAPKLSAIGSGQLAAELEQDSRIVLMGQLPPHAVYQQMAGSLALLLPSTVFEGFPRVIAEAYACGLPVIASRLGPLANLVEDGRTGLLFDPGSPEDLAQKVKWAEENRQSMLEMGKAARELYEQRFTSTQNYRSLIGIYQQAIQEFSCAKDN